MFELLPSGCDGSRGHAPWSASDKEELERDIFSSSASTEEVSSDLERSDKEELEVSSQEHTPKIVVSNQTPENPEDG